MLLEKEHLKKEHLEKEHLEKEHLEKEHLEKEYMEKVPSISNRSIRPAVPEDGEALVEIYRPYVERTAISFEYETPTTEEFQERIRHTLKRYPYLVALEGEQIVGYAYAAAFKERAAYDRSVETTIYLKEGFKGRGYGARLYESLEEALKKQGILNMNACIAYTDREDEQLTNASMRFHQRMGFDLVGRFHQCGYKFGKWYDMIWMEKLIGPHR